MTRTPRTQVLAGAAVAAPALLIGSTVAYMVGGGLGDDATGGTIQVYAGIALGLAIVGITGRLERHLPRLAAALTVTGLVGVAGAVGFGQDSIISAAHPTIALSEQGSASAAIALLLPGLFLPATLVAIGAATARTGIAPRWAGLLLAAGGACFPVSRIGSIAPLALVADTLIAAGMVTLGLTGLRAGRSAAPSVAVLTGAVAA